MLTKNVYIIYPAGYHGNYFKWAIESSDIDMINSGTVPTNPLNTQTSNQWGGVGTTHKSVRIPTHASVQQIVPWIIYNRPTIKKVYVIQAGLNKISVDRASTDIQLLLTQDPEGIVISINNNNDPDVSSYGIINAVTKWPTFLPASDQSEGYDPFNCANDLFFRNQIVKNKITAGEKNIVPLEAIEEKVETYNRWYRTRYQHQPHEMDPAIWPHDITWRDRYFAVGCNDIISNKFPELLRDILSKANISDNVDTKYVDQVHSEFINIQPNLQWFKSVRQWEETGIIDDYIRSHSIIQAEILKRIFKYANLQPLTYDSESRFLQFYYSHYADKWPIVTTELDFYKLPEHIKQELIASGIKLTHSKKPCQAMVELDWETMSIDEINDVFQREKLKDI